MFSWGAEDSAGSRFGFWRRALWHFVTPSGIFFFFKISKLNSVTTGVTILFSFVFDTVFNVPPMLCSCAGSHTCMCRNEE